MIDIKLVGDKELSIYLENIDKNMKNQLNLALIDVGTYLKEKVKDRLGTYHYTWPKLKRATVQAKYHRRNMAGISIKNRKKSSFGLGGDDPLVLFSNLKKSIYKETNKAALETVVYSDNEYSAVHEYGYKNVPARSYMRTTLYDNEDVIFSKINDYISKLI